MNQRVCQLVAGFGALVSAFQTVIPTPNVRRDLITNTPTAALAGDMKRVGVQLQEATKGAKDFKQTEFSFVKA